MAKMNSTLGIRTATVCNAQISKIKQVKILASYPRKVNQKQVVVRYKLQVVNHELRQEADLCKRQGGIFKKRVK